jgi:hypothetical protein
VHRHRAATVVVAALLSIALTTPAEAVTAFGSVVRMTSNGCGGVVGTSPTGTTRGFVICSATSGWRFVQGSGASWSTASSPYGNNTDILAVAVDGTTTWFVTTSDSGTYIRRRSGSTYYTGIRLTPKRVNPREVGLVASGGKYHAVWAQENGAGGSTLWEAHTLNSVLQPRRFYGSLTSGTAEHLPSLAYQSSSHKVVVAWTRAVTQSQQSVVMSYSSGASWHAPISVASGAYGTSLAVSGSTVVIGYAAMAAAPCSCSRVATGTISGITARRALSGQSYSVPRVAISSGVVGAVWQSGISPYPVRATTRVSGTWSERTIGSPYPTASNGLVGVASVSGKLRFFAYYGYLGMRTQ